MNNLISTTIEQHQEALNASFTSKLRGLPEDVIQEVSKAYFANLTPYGGISDSRTLLLEEMTPFVEEHCPTLAWFNKKPTFDSVIETSDLHSYGGWKRSVTSIRWYQEEVEKEERAALETLLKRLNLDLWQGNNENVPGQMNGMLQLIESRTNLVNQVQIVDLEGQLISRESLRHIGQVLLKTGGIYTDFFTVPELLGKKNENEEFLLHHLGLDRNGSAFNGAQRVACHAESALQINNDALRLDYRTGTACMVFIANRPLRGDFSSFLLRQQYPLSLVRASKAKFFWVMAAAVQIIGGQAVIVKNIKIQ